MLVSPFKRQLHIVTARGQGWGWGANQSNSTVSSEHDRDQGTQPSRVFAKTTRSERNFRVAVSRHLSINSIAQVHIAFAPNNWRESRVACTIFSQHWMLHRDRGRSKSSKWCLSGPERASWRWYEELPRILTYVLQSWYLLCFYSSLDSH